MTFLADHDVEGQATVLFGLLAAEGWLDLLPLELVTLPEVGLGIDTSDREVWRCAQSREILLLTANRSMSDPHSLERTIREENTPTSLPVITVANAQRLDERDYRDRCALRLVEILVDVEHYLGAGRLYIP